MKKNSMFENALLDKLAELLDIPISHYQHAIERYKSLSEHFQREESTLLIHEPAMSVQGSFRYGTVNRPLIAAEEYDLDLCTTLKALAKTSMSQANLKKLVGAEIKAYARQHGMNEPEEKRRCWRLDYADQIKFHMDTCPGVPEDARVKALLRVALERAGENPQLAEHAIAITCKDDPEFDRISSQWPSSNPEGLALWFESRMRLEGLTRAKKLVAARLYASIDDVPAYEWKTPLQRATQVLKRHRDVMFKDNPDGRPISMIITTLAAQAYDGETDLYTALIEIVERIPTFVRKQKPKVPNPVNPAEDFANKWSNDPKLEKNFWLWHQQVKADLEGLAQLTTTERIQRFIKSKFAAQISDQNAADIVRMRPSRPSVPQIVVPSVPITSPPRPWGI